MKLDRRELIRMFGLTFVVSMYKSSPLSAFDFHSALASPLPRMPLYEFVKDPTLLDGLRLAVKEMKKRKPSDPLSWFYQAAIHGVTNEAIQEALKSDSNVKKVLEKNIWNQCPHNGQNSANFLPWHRAYTYHVEKILRLHSGLDNFSTPYWDYIDKNSEDKRTFPREFGIKHLDGDQNNDNESNINPLYLEARDYYLTNYEHPFSEGLPLGILSRDAVDISQPLNSLVFFGKNEDEGIGGGIKDIDPTTRGLLEKYPHDQIHRAVGGIVIDGNSGKESVGAMANPPTAAFDPIFSIHHSTIDWIWVKWSCIPGKRWGALPSDDWFNDKPWLFIDTDGKIINEPRKSYFDHRALGVSYKYEDLNANTLQLPPISLALHKSVNKFKYKTPRSITDFNLQIVASNTHRTVTKLTSDNLKKVFSKIRNIVTVNQSSRIILRLKDVRLGLVYGKGFNLYLTTNSEKEFTPEHPSFIGSITLFEHDHSHMFTANHQTNMSQPNPQSFDATKAFSQINSYDNLALVIIPFSLVELRTKDAKILNEQLKINGIEILEM